MRCTPVQPWHDNVTHVHSMSVMISNVDSDRVKMERWHHLVRSLCVCLIDGTDRERGVSARFRTTNADT